MLTVEQPLTTDRLLLRAFHERDLDAVHALQSDPDVVRYLPWPVSTREQSEAWLAQRVAQRTLEPGGPSVAWAVVRRADDGLVGTVNAWWRSAEHESAEIGFAFAREAQGRGYAAEAVGALLDALFTSLSVRRVTGRADARNTASTRFMERLGMRCEGRFREDELFKGEWTDTVVHAVLRHEWLSLRTAGGTAGPSALDTR